MVRETVAASMRAFIPLAVTVRPSTSEPMWAWASKTRAPAGIFFCTQSQGSAIAPAVSAPRSWPRSVVSKYARRSIPPEPTATNGNRALSPLLNFRGMNPARPLVEALNGALGDAFRRAARPLSRGLLRRTLPKLEGVTRLTGLESPVEILRDRFGVPQIFAENEHDLFFAQGYVHAQDRFFQMELGRRAGHGRLSELLGKSTLEFDRCVSRGFEGLKLHPISQEFELDDARVIKLFEMAVEADLPVLVHAGMGMRRIVEPLLPTIERLPNLRLILGHSAMVELLAATRAFKDYPNVLFETSVVRAKDLFVLFCSLEPTRICYGSDIPYGDLPSTLHATLAAAAAAGLSEEEISCVLSGNIRRWFP